MIQKIISDKHIRSYFGIGLAWMLVWVIPWGKLPSIQEGNFLAFSTDMLRLGVALLIFIFPGALLYLLLMPVGEPDFDLRGLLPIGFSLSVFFIAAIGLIGKFAGLSFGLVKSAFVITGTVELIVLIIVKPNFVLNKNRLVTTIRTDLRNPPLILALIIATLMTFHDSLLALDDLSYLAYITNWQNSAHLGFQNIVHEGYFSEHARFWLALYPMSQALLSDLSGVPGILLLGSYLELFLVPLAVLTSYWFALRLGLSRKAAGFASLIQISLYTWMVGEQFPVGMWFYQNLAEDKVTAVFILTPVFIIFALRFIKASATATPVLLWLAGLSLTFTHPVILFFTCIVAAGMALIACAEKEFGRRKLLQLFLMFGLLMLPYLGIRLSGDPSQDQIPFDAESAQDTFIIEKFTNIVNDRFYGLNPEVLKFFDIPPESGGHSIFQYIRAIPIVLAIIAVVLAFTQRSKGALYWYILASSLLVFFATLPYTGWLLGYFVSARLLSRASWYLPLGLSGVIILISARFGLGTRPYRGVAGVKRFQKRLGYGTMAGMIACFIFISPVWGSRILPRIPFYFKILDHYKQLAQIGSFIDEHTIEPVTVVALDYWDTQLLPGVSAKTQLISFREESEYNGFNYFLSIDKIHERRNASNVIRSLEPGVIEMDRCIYLEKYDVKFILVGSKVAQRYEEKLQMCNLVLSRVFQTKDQILLEFK